MEADSISYDSLDARPLPKWLTDQRDGLHTWQPPKMEMKEDRSLEISLIITGAIVLFSVIVLTIFLLRRKKKRNL